MVSTLLNPIRKSDTITGTYINGVWVFHRSGNVVMCQITKVKDLPANGTVVTMSGAIPSDYRPKQGLHYEFPVGSGLVSTFFTNAGNIQLTWSGSSALSDGLVSQTITYFID